MAPNLNLTRQECAARGDQLDVRSYRVALDLTGAPDDAKTFRSETTVVFDSTGDSTWLDLVADYVEEITINGETVAPFSYDGARVLLHDLTIGSNIVTVVAHCYYSRTGEGLHRFTDPEDDSTYLYTHCEPTDARRVFACFEQPDLKGEFTFEVTAPTGWVVRSNQPEVQASARGEHSVHTFAPTPPLSTYLIALIAGPYASVEDEWSVERADGTTQRIALTALCRRGMREHLEHEEIFEITKAGFSFYDSAFGYPFPWGLDPKDDAGHQVAKYDQVFVPEYNIGAMENPGLVTFKESYLFRGGATAIQRTSRSEVILHEMAHMWFGDLVTPKWWDDLWLKESFADLMGYQVSQEQTRFDQAWLQFATSRKLWAYTHDQLPTTHPVIARIDDLEAARQNFDGITYAKGASVLRQLQAIVGTDAFFAGSRDYFRDHAFGAATFNDLLTALQPHTEHDLHAWADLWLRTTTPTELTAQVSRGEDGSITELVVRQACTDRITGEEVVRPHAFRTAGYMVDGDRLTRSFAAELTLTGTQAELTEALGKRADLVVLNSGDLTYAICRLDDHSRETAAKYASTIEDDLDRGAVWTALWNLTRDGIVPAAEFVAAFSSQAPTEPNSMLLRIFAGQLKTAIGRYLPANERPQAWTQVAQLADAALSSAPAGSDLQRTWAEITAELGAHTDATTQSMRGLAGGTTPDGLELTDELRWQLATALVRRGVWHESDVDAVLAQDDTLIGRTHALTARAAAPAHAGQTWRRLVEDDLTNDEQRALLAGWALTGSGVEFSSDYLGLLDTVWTDRAQTMAQRLVIELFPTIDDNEAGREALAAVQRWYDEHPQAPAALRRVVLEQIDQAQRALRAQRAQKD
ncbi:aminopeptidase N [Yimella sp. cx-573]|nr:aminopeptidase N [Yimella sp. cx-573]